MKCYTRNKIFREALNNDSKIPHKIRMQFMDMALKIQMQELIDSLDPVNMVKSIFHKKTLPLDFGTLLKNFREKRQIK